MSAIARIVPFAAAALAAAAAPAYASPLDTAPSAVVRHGDLDLTTASGVAQLQGRIAVAAKMVCGRYDPLDLNARTAVLGCRRETVANAAPKVELAVAAARNREVAAAAGGAAAISIP